MQWPSPAARAISSRSEEHTSELQSLTNLVCRLLLEKKKEICEERAIASLVSRILLRKKQTARACTCKNSTDQCVDSHRCSHLETVSDPHSADHANT